VQKRTAKRLGPLISDMLSRQISTLYRSDPVCFVSIFLDEIGEMPLNLQPKLLRTIEAKEILSVGATNPVHAKGETGGHPFVGGSPHPPT
jgi:hypothetical protein